MAGGTVITIVGNLTADPELRFTPGGVAVADFTVASTERYYDRDTSEWKDGPATFLRCTVWREYAEQVAESLKRGQRVIVQGLLRQENWETGEGEKRSRLGVQVIEVGPSLRYGTAKFAKVERNRTEPRRFGQPADDREPPEDEPPY